jgi:hypothetical protein
MIRAAVWVLENGITHRIDTTPEGLPEILGALHSNGGEVLLIEYDEILDQRDKNTRSRITKFLKEKGVLK